MHRDWWNPSLEISTNTKVTKGPQTTELTYRLTDRQTDRWKDGWKDRWTDRQIYYTPTQDILTRGLWMHALCAITGCANDCLKSTQTTGQRDRHTYNL